MSVAQQVKDIVSKQLDVSADKVVDAAAFIDDLGADSLAIVELVLKFEDSFDIEIPDEDTEKIRTVGDAVSYIEGRLAK